MFVSLNKTIKQIDLIELDKYIIWDIFNKKLISITQIIQA